ncbi:MAG: DUF3738 domain-containing protein [Hymenobacter sp.]|nr:DUF3738 domain-containing protein [Hymenobacter sp.]
MRKFPCLTLALSLPMAASAQTALRVGDQLPDFVLPRVVNGNAPTFAPADAKEKVLVLEFWGTYCSPCIPALQRLDALQQRYPADLQVVGISTDSEARLQKFLAKRPLTVPLASAPDDKQDINLLFPHRIISHTVVVDRNRRVVAITSPGQFTEAALREVVAGKTISLKLKQDVMGYDPMSYFAVDSTTRYGVNVRPYIQGLGGQMHLERKGPFARRRLTAINVDPASLFQLAYETSNRRILNQLPDSLRQYNDLTLLCFDLIVPPGQEANLRPIMREALRLYLPVRADWVPMTKPAYVLRRAKNRPALPASSKPKNYRFGGGEFSMEGSPMETLRDYLENELGKPVVDETGLTGRYDVALVTQNENLKPSIYAALAKLGLEVVEAPRTIKMLRLSPALAGK